MTKVLVAILAGFAIAVPSTFWLLKKVRIKSKIRYFQVVLTLALPTALFAFLLQTSFTVPVFVITVISSLLIVALELTLRSLVSRSPSRSVTFDKGQNGTLVPFEEARAAAGAYPCDYMTKEFWIEMQEFMKSRSLQKQKFKSTLSGNSPFNAFEMHRSINFVGINYKIFGGIRCTTDQPANVSPTQNINIFGASIVFCEEVPDRLTIASILQRILNSTTKLVKVLNYGASGATTIDRVQLLIDVVDIQEDDVVVVYFGGADTGWIDRRSGKESRQLIWLPIRALRALSELGIETARWLSIELSPLSLRKYSRLAVSETVNALDLANEYCASRGVKMIALLSPNLYTLRTKSQYERQLEKRFSIDMRNLVLESYRHYEVWSKETPYAVSATHIFDNAEAPVFLDWAHVNARGNELIAKFIFEELKKRNLISVDEEA